METKVVLITGASSGIGEATALHFSKIGYKKLIIVARREDRLKALAEKCKELGAEKVLPLSRDLAQLEVCEEIIETIIGEFGRLDVFFSNAGTNGRPFLAKEVTAEELTHVMNVNYNSGVLLTKYALPHLEKVKGAIVYNASVGSTLVVPLASVYNGSKGALKQFARTVAFEEASNGVRVNIVSPGFTATELLTTGVFGKDMNVIREMTKGVIPQARVAEAEEMAKVIAFMVSEENTYMQGNEIFLDGGLMLTNSMNLPVMKQYLEATGKQ